MPSTPVRIAVLLAFAGGTAAIFVLLFGQAGGRIPLGHPYRATVTVPTAVQLVPNSDVRAAGVKVGTVTSVEPDAAGHARVGVILDHGFAPLYRDARVLVRTKTVLGENYLSIDPGTPAAGAVRSGGSLPLARAEDAVLLDQILSTFDAPTRRRLRADL